MRNILVRSSLSVRRSHWEHSFHFACGLSSLGLPGHPSSSPKICGSPGDPPITAPRIKLRDGRYLAYKEHGVPKDKAKYKFVYVPGFDSCRHHASIATKTSTETIESLGLYIVSLDRPGYRESDPDPKRTEKSIALDIEELADQLEFGPKFYLVGFSMGGQVVWCCLKYIPHRLAGASLLTPVVNYWWHGFPSNFSSEIYKKQPKQDQWALRVAYYAPFLTYWWNTQKWFPSCSSIVYSALLLFIIWDVFLQMLPKH